MIDIQSYWPQLENNNALFVTFAPASYKRYSYDANYKAYRLDEWDGNKVWKDCWYYRISKDKGVLEVADDYPNYSWLTWLSPIRRFTYKTGFENQWGNTQEVGDIISQQVRQDTWFNTSSSYGWNWVLFETDKYLIDTNNTQFESLQMVRVETWDNNSKYANWYMAKGLGFIKFDWFDNSGNVYPQIMTSYRYGLLSDSFP